MGRDGRIAGEMEYEEVLKHDFLREIVHGKLMRGK